MTDIALTRRLIDQLDHWVNELARPLLPVRREVEADGSSRPVFREHTPRTVMVGKLIRASSGIKAALLLADEGFLAECAALLRMVSDFCIEVTAIAGSLLKGEPPIAVRTFVEQYFVPKARTPEELAARERTFYVSREELMKVEARLSEGTEVNGEHLRTVRRFLNMGFDAYVHGAYETTMELYNPRTGRFMMAGHESSDKRRNFVEAVAGKLHEVVFAIELTAGICGHADIYEEARAARHALDAAEETSSSQEGSA